jgi:hypothetical protein
MTARDLVTTGLTVAAIYWLGYFITVAPLVR